MSEESQSETQPDANESPQSAAESRAPSADSGRSPASEAGETGLDFVLDVPLKLRVEIGQARMLVRDVLQLGKGSVIELDRMNGEPADVLVNDRLIARGEVTLVDERVAVRIVEVVGAEGLGGKLD